MRLDKFLKVSRLIKRRTVANEVSDTGRVFVNGNPAKPAKQYINLLNLHFRLEKKCRKRPQSQGLPRKKTPTAFHTFAGFMLHSHSEKHIRSRILLLYHGAPYPYAYGGDYTAGFDINAKQHLQIFSH